MARTKPNPPGLRPFTEDKRRANKIAEAMQTNLMASDPFHGIKSNKSTVSDFNHTTSEALRFVGYRGGKDWFGEDSRPLQYCICDAVAENGEIDAESVVRCGNRDCPEAFFHLRCVKLPDHPPMRLGWMCPTCIEKHGITESYNGLWDIKRSEGKNIPRAWLREENDLLKAREDAIKRQRFWERLGEDDFEDDQPTSNKSPTRSKFTTTITNFAATPNRGYGEVHPAFPNSHIFPHEHRSPSSPLNPVPTTPVTPRSCPAASRTRQKGSVDNRSDLWGPQERDQPSTRRSRGGRISVQTDETDETDETEVVVTETNSEVAEMERNEGRESGEGTSLFGEREGNEGESEGGQER